MKIRMLMTVMALAIVVGARAGQVGEKQARQKASAFSRLAKRLRHFFLAVRQRVEHPR